MSGTLDFDELMLMSKERIVNELIHYKRTAFNRLCKVEQLEDKLLKFEEKPPKEISKKALITLDEIYLSAYNSRLDDPNDSIGRCEFEDLREIIGVFYTEAKVLEMEFESRQ